MKGILIALAILGLAFFCAVGWHFFDPYRIELCAVPGTDYPWHYLRCKDIR